MDEIWDIPARDEQKILALIEEGEETNFGKIEDDIPVEIINVDKSSYSKRVPESGVIGTVYNIEDHDEEIQLVLGAAPESRYIARFNNPHAEPIFHRTSFVAKSSLHEGFYFFRTMNVEFRRDPNTEEWRIPIQLPLFRIHRPHLEGCRAEATIRVTEKSEASGKFEFLGINGGAGSGFTTQLSTKISAGSVCKEEVIPAILIAEHGATLVEDQPVAYGVRYRIVDVDPSERKTRQIPLGVDQCEQIPSTPKPKPPFWATFDKTEIPANDSDNDGEGAKLGSTDFINIGLGSEIGSIPFKVSVEMKRTMELEYEVNTILKGGAKYLRFPVKSSNHYLPFEMCWSILERV